MNLVPHQESSTGVKAVQGLKESDMLFVLTKNQRPRFFTLQGIATALVAPAVQVLSNTPFNWTPTRDMLITKMFINAYKTNAGSSYAKQDCLLSIVGQGISYVPENVSGFSAGNPSGSTGSLNFQCAASADNAIDLIGAEIYLPAGQLAQFFMAANGAFVVGDLLAFNIGIGYKQI